MSAYRVTEPPVADRPAPWSIRFGWALGGLLGLVLSISSVQGAEAATLRLGPDCGPSIQACVNAAADGDLILVAARTGKGKPNDAYYENVVVDKRLRIRGVANLRSTACLDPRRAVDDLGQLRRNAPAVVLDAAAAGDPGGDGIFVTVGGAGTTIECLVIRHGQNGLRSTEDGVTASKVAAIGQNLDGISMLAASQRVLDSLVIGGDRIGIFVVGAGGLARGNWVRSMSDLCIGVLGDNAVLIDNHVRRCDDVGFTVSGEAPRLTGNTADSTAQDGFVVECTGNCAAGFVRGNAASSTSGGASGFTINLNASPARWEISGNRAFRNSGPGFSLFVNDALISGNVAERNGTGLALDAEGFRLVGGGNTLLRNVARFNKRDGFVIQGDANELGDGTDANHNRSERNLMDGFDVESGNGNELNNNLARHNQGEGVENNGTATVLRNNTALNNRTDCANSGTMAVNTGNSCGDNSDFAAPPEVERSQIE